MKKIFWTILAMAVLYGCKKEEKASPCSQLRQAVMEENIPLVKEEINRIAMGLKATVSDTDPDGSKSLLQQLTGRINNQCGIQAAVICYNCIYTLPAQSEIRISFQTGNLSFEKILDIILSKENQLQCVNMHD